MKELTIELLAPYLPFQLQVHHTEWQSLLVMNATGEGNNNMSIDDVPEYCKPVLRPLSDLTKEIEVNGERFVPIEELMKIGLYHVWDERASYYHSQLEIKVDHPNALTFTDNKKTFHFFFKEESFHCLDDKYKPVQTTNQVELFRKLYSWHFDLHNLINRSLAISIHSHEIKLEK